MSGVQFIVQPARRLLFSQIKGISYKNLRLHTKKTMKIAKSSPKPAKTANLWRIVESYERFIATYGWKAQAINTSVLVGLGNIFSQTIVLGRWRSGTFDKFECARYFAVGLVILGPAMHLWYTRLDVIVKIPGLRGAVCKMLMDQILYLPPYVASIIAIMGFLCREPSTKIIEDIKRDFVPIMEYCYMGWPWIQVLNFHYVPLRHRILLMNCVGLFYNTLIAWKIEQNRHKEQDILKESARIYHSIP